MHQVRLTLLTLVAGLAAASIVHSRAIVLAARLAPADAARRLALASVTGRVRLRGVTFFPRWNIGTQLQRLVAALRYFDHRDADRAQVTALHQALELPDDGRRSGYLEGNVRAGVF